MKSTIIKKGVKASIVLGVGALLSACSSKEKNPSTPTTAKTSTHSILAITKTTTPTSSSSAHFNGFSTSFSAYIYEDEGHNVFNVPIIKVYIDGQPVNLILDTGDSGLVVNQSAVNIPSSDYISNSAYKFSMASDSGILASATVCLNPSITSSCVIMPIGVSTSGTLFPGEPNEGVFGLAGIGDGIIGFTFNGNGMRAFSYPHYLEQQTGINSYQISFISLSNNYYANVSQTQPIGQISFGNYNGNYNTLTPYNDGLSVTFGSYPTNTYDILTFDTASPFNFLGERDLQAALADIIPNYSPNQQEGACAQYGWPNVTQYWPNSRVDNSVVNSSYTISYTMRSYTGSFVTEPPVSFCSSPPAFNLLTGVTIDGSTALGNFVSNFGLPAMFGHTFTYVLGAPSSGSQGIVKYLGISP